MRFEEVYERWTEHRLTQQEAADIARYRQCGLAAARSSLFALAWHEPQRLASIIAQLGDELLDRDWRAFKRACEWETVEEAQQAAWFPAWSMIATKRRNPRKAGLSSYLKRLTARTTKSQ